MRHRQTKVLLALGWYEHSHIEGIYRYAFEKGWTINLWQFGPDRTPVEEALRQFNPYGIISQLHTRWPDLVKAVEEADVPTVELSAVSGMRVPCVIPDAKTAGTMAAAHLLERGFVRFMFVGYSDTHETQNAFVQTVRAGGGDARVVNLNDPAITGATGNARPLFATVHDEHAALRRAWARRFFSTCDKPFGVLVMSTTWAADIIEGCRDARIKVPEQVAVMSLTDMNSECAAWPVPLTVISPGFEEQGYQAAALLDRMMKGERVPPDTVVRIPPKSLVPRKSTFCYASDNKPIARVATFIMHNLHNPGLSVKHVCRATKVPRSSIYYDFPRHFKMPVAEYIEHLRLKEAVNLLETTDASVGVIAEQCGFGEPRRFRNALIRTTRMAPLAYRQKHQSKAPSAHGG